MAYRIEYTDSAIDDIAYFTKYERGLITTAIETQLTYEPLREVRNRKPMEPAGPLGSSRREVSDLLRC